jgi:hypothetical protein
VRWWCRGCLGGQRWQDAIAYVERRDGVDDFPEACRRLGASTSELTDDRHARARHVAAALGLRPASESLLPEDRTPSPHLQAAALAFVSCCESTLWSPVGAQARVYLEQRGLAESECRWLDGCIRRAVRQPCYAAPTESVATWLRSIRSRSTA